MTYRMKALISTVILAPILGGLQWKMFALDFCQRFGTTLYIIEWTVSYTKHNNICETYFMTQREVLEHLTKR